MPSCHPDAARPCAGERAEPRSVRRARAASRRRRADARARLPSGRALDRPSPDRDRRASSDDEALRQAGLFEVVVEPLEPRLEPLDRLPSPRHVPATTSIEIDDPYRYGRVLTDFDLHLFGEGTHHRVFEKLGAHRITIGTTTGVHFAVWAPERRARQRGRRLQRVGRPRPPDAAARAGRRLGDLHPGSAGRRALQVRDPHAHGRAAAEDRSVRRRVRGAAALGVDRPRHLRLPVARRRVDDGAAAARRLARPADVDLRGAPRLVGARAGGRRPLPDVPRAGEPARAVREGDWASRTSSCCR